MVTVQDTTPPTISLDSNTLSLAIGETFTAPTPTVTDNANGEPTLTITGDDFETNVGGEHTVTYTVRDASDNLATVTLVVSIYGTLESISLSATSFEVEVSNALTVTHTLAPTDATASYSVFPELPNGLSFDSITGVLSGTPTAIGTTIHTLTATGNGFYTGVVSTTFELRIIPSTTFSDLSFTTDKPPVLEFVVGQGNTDFLENGDGLTWDIGYIRATVGGFSEEAGTDVKERAFVNFQVNDVNYFIDSNVSMNIGYKVRVTYNLSAPLPNAFTGESAIYNNPVGERAKLRVWKIEGAGTVNQSIYSVSGTDGSGVQTLFVSSVLNLEGSKTLYLNDVAVSFATATTAAEIVTILENAAPDSLGLTATNNNNGSISLEATSDFTLTLASSTP